MSTRETSILFFWYFIFGDMLQHGAWGVSPASHAQQQYLCDKQSYAILTGDDTDLTVAEQ